MIKQCVFIHSYLTNPKVSLGIGCSEYDAGFLSSQVQPVSLDTFLCGHTGICPLGLVLARQALYCLSHASSFFYSGCF
jgi:hypothetical protein